MLYVFLVDTGTMMTFEMNLALDDVTVLKRAIARTCSIPEDQQVLLISGGTSLDPSMKVCTYGSGTDTCPIFLFSKCSIGSDIPPCPSVGCITEINMTKHVAECLEMPNTYQSLAIRVQLAQQFAELATKEVMVCERMVHDQRLQQQGWATVIANLEDSTRSFQQQAACSDEVFQQYLESRPTYQALLEDFHGPVSLLSKIPLLPSLLPEESTSEEKTEEKTLYDWLTTESSSELEILRNQCMRCIEQFTEETFIVLKKEVQEVLGNEKSSQMKEIAGLEERLFALDHLMSQAKKVERDQIKQAQNLHQQQKRVDDYNDMSVLPDLCTTHQQQLNIMLTNHQCLREMREKCTRAKIELSNNLHKRLQWILKIESVMYEVGNKLFIHRETLKRLRQQMETIQQIHAAPSYFARNASEVCRRRKFSGSYHKWASCISSQANDLYQKEVSKRKTFNSQFSNNLVNSLFPGMEDFPPPFAIECPEPFDVHLPKIVPEDLERLKQKVPEMAHMIEIPEPEPMPQICTTSDSAFSSEVPLSHITGRSTSASLGIQPFRTENQESLSIGDYASAVNETTSLASSPFEDPTFPSTSMDVSGKHGKSSSRKKCDDSEVECKRLHLIDAVAEKETFSPIEEEQNNVESDAEEFERVDDVPKSEEQFEDPCAITDKKSSSDLLPRSDLRTRSESECIKTPAVGAGPKLVFQKAHSEGDPTSPVEERLRSPDSLLTSQDFQQADYYIDESMPSSYTESNASGLLKGNQMVKSHHIIVAELQHQLEEKNVVIASTQGKLKMSRSNILKLRRTITALQKYIQDVQEGLKRDLLRLKEYVTTEKCIALEELASTMEEVKTVVSGIQTRIHSDKEDAVNEAVKRERESLEVILQKHQHKLEVEAQKLSDCQAEIDMYQEQIRQHQLVLDDLRQDADCKLEEFKRELCEEKDNVIKSMMLEHELEMENIKDQAKRKVQEKEDTLKELQEILAEKDAQIQKLFSEKESRDAEEEEKMKKVQELLTSTLESAFQQRQEAAVKWALEQQTEVHQEEIRKLNEEQALLRKEKELLMKQYEAKINSVKLEFEENLKQSLMEQKLNCEREKESELQKMKETLGAYKEEIESMQSRFKYAYSSTTSMERMPSDSSLENLHLEKDVIHIASHEKALSQLQEKFEEEKAQLIDAERKKSQDNVLDAVSAEREKHDSEMDELSKRLQSEHEEQIERLKIRYGAEKQVAFNEAINKVTREKDSLIEELRAFIVSMEAHQSAIKSLLDQTVQDICDASEQLSSSSSDSGSEEKIIVERTVADKLSEAIHRVRELRSQIEASSSSATVPLPVASDMLEKRTSELGMELKKKIEEMAAAKTKFKNVVAEKEAEIQMLLSEKVSRETEQEERLKKEQDLLSKTLEATFQQQQEAAVKWALDQQMQVHQAEMKKLQEEQELLKKDFELQLSHLQEEYETKLCSFKLKCEENVKLSLMEQELKCHLEKDSEVQQMKETLGAQYKEEVESMRSRFKYAYSSTSMQRMPSDSSLENLHLEKDVIHIVAHEKALSQLQEKYESEKDEIITKAVEAEREKSQGAILEALSAERQKYDNEMTELKNRLHSEFEEQIERLRIHHRAEKQVTFNEVINRVTREKDGLIEELRSRVGSMETQQSAIKSLLDQIMQDISHVSEEISSSSSDSVSDDKTMVDRTVTDRLVEAIHRVKEIRNQIDQPSSPVLDPLAASSDTLEKRFSEMEMELKKKKEELAKMKMKIMKLSVSGGFQDLSQLDKVSVLTCNVGDLVLLCYEEKHENYVVFYFGPVPHFLHTDSLELLKLQIPPEEPRKAWALVEVLEKEYCQAKKIDNRYKVPYGSRFYRVKVKFWDREAAIRRYNQRRLTSSVSSECPKPSTSGSSSDDVPPKGGPMSSSTI